jgi:predicted nucleic acid-binding protein
VTTVGSADVVVDASAFVRGLTTAGTAADWVDRILDGEVRAIAPDIVYPELANATVTAARFGSGAATLLDDFLGLPLETEPSFAFVRPAAEIALELGLSAYDALYVALAEALDAPLVTADRRLAAAYPGCELVS